MFEHKKVKAGRKIIEGISIGLQAKSFVLLRGSKGYVMCGYLDLRTAEKFQDAAVKITGVASVKDALNASVHSCTSAARKLGVRKGQPVRDILSLIA